MSLAAHLHQDVVHLAQAGFGHGEHVVGVADVTQRGFEAFAAGQHFGGDGQTRGVVGGAVDALAGREPGLVDRELLVNVLQRIQGIQSANVTCNTSYIYVSHVKPPCLS